MIEATEAAFLALAAYLKQQNYSFICPTPESQQRVLAKRNQDPEKRKVANLEDFYGWSLAADRYKKSATTLCICT